MRTFIFLLFLLQYTFCLSQSTTYNSFEGGVFFGGAWSKDMGGISTGLEARYNFSDQISAGLQLGSIVLVDVEEAIRTEGDVEGGITLNSLSIVGDYYFKNTKRRFFTGLELGYYRSKYVQTQTRETNLLGNRIGVTPRIGARFGWFQPVLKHHFIPKINDTNFSSWDFTLGIVFGGKKK